MPEGVTIAEISRWPDGSPLQPPLVGTLDWVFPAQENERGKSQGFKLATGEPGPGGKPLTLTCSLMATEHEPDLPALTKGMAVTIQARYSDAKKKWVGVTKGTANPGTEKAYPKLNIYGASHIRFAADAPYPAALSQPGEPNYQGPGPASAPPPEYTQPTVGYQPPPPRQVPGPPPQAAQSNASHSQRLTEVQAREVWKRNFEDMCRFFGFDLDQRLAVDMAPHAFEACRAVATTILIAVQDGKVEEGT